MPVAGRRDTPAARAALARRRQRVAQDSGAGTTSHTTPAAADAPTTIQPIAQQRVILPRRGGPTTTAAEASTTTMQRRGNASPSILRVPTAAVASGSRTSASAGSTLRTSRIVPPSVSSRIIGSTTRPTTSTVVANAAVATAAPNKPNTTTTARPRRPGYKSPLRGTPDPPPLMLHKKPSPVSAAPTIVTTTRTTAVSPKERNVSPLTKRALHSMAGSSTNRNRSPNSRTSNMTVGDATMTTAALTNSITMGVGGASNSSTTPRRNDINMGAARRALESSSKSASVASSVLDARRTQQRGVKNNPGLTISTTTATAQHHRLQPSSTRIGTKVVSSPSPIALTESAQITLSARANYRGSSPRSAATSTTQQHAATSVMSVAESSRTTASPSRFQREADLLAASKRRQNRLESRHRFNVANHNRSTQEEATTTTTSPKTTTSLRPQSSTGGVAQRMGSAEARLREKAASIRSKSAIGKQPSSISPSKLSSYLTSSPESPEESQKERRFFGNLSTPSRQQQQQQPIRTSARKQSPVSHQQSPSRRRPFSSGGLPPPSPRSNTPKAASSPMSPATIQQPLLAHPAQPSSITGSTTAGMSTSLTQRARVEHERKQRAAKSRSPSPQRGQSAKVATGSPSLAGSDPYSAISYTRPMPTPLNTLQQTPPISSARKTGDTGRASPGVERLSSFLMDSLSIHGTKTQEEASASLAEYETPVKTDYSTPTPPLRPTPTVTPGGSKYQQEYYAEEDLLDDQATIDDGKIQSLDVACLHQGSCILLRSYSTSATVLAKENTTSKYFLAETLGSGLGNQEEMLTIRKVSNDPMSESIEVRHGDTILLLSAVAEKRALGARKLISADGLRTKMELGFFSTGTSRAEAWVILNAKLDKEVLVGRSALQAAKKKNSANNNEGHLSLTNGGTLAPVRSGDPILLRNCHNGGMLSVNGQGELFLVTDSYEHGQENHDPSLMGRLQHHDRLFPTRADVFQFLLSSTPPCPPWITGRSLDERIFLTGSYILQPKRNQRSAEFEAILFAGAPRAPLLEAAARYMTTDANLTARTKEKILIDEVIGSFLGLEGLHLRMKGSKGHTSKLDNFEFQLFDADGLSFDVSLRHLVEQILPLSTSYVRVRNFVYSRHPGYEYGRVMQALCEALDELLQDYVNFVSLLERELRKYATSENFTMKNIFYQITPSIHSMKILEHVTQAVSEKKGGALINAIWSLDQRAYMGDVVAKKVLGILLEKATAPYMEMMCNWLQSGKLTDPYEEFMIRRTSGPAESTPDFDGDSWMRIFAVNENHVLDGAISTEWIKKKILTTGKYWNAVQACQVDICDYIAPGNGSATPKVIFNSDSSQIAVYIDSMYQRASRVLVDLMADKFRLSDSLTTMKRYFLLDQGDFLSHFLDATERELIKPHSEVAIGTVQHWLTTSVQMTESYREDDSRGPTEVASNSLVPAGLKCRFLKQSLVEYLDSLYGGISNAEFATPSRQAYGASTKENSGVERFTIDFPRIPFPLSLVLSGHAMDNYKLIFRHLFFTKHVERRLIGVWRDHQLLKKLDSLRGLLGETFLLRQRMLYFVQNLIYYMVFEVIENNWTEMISVVDPVQQSDSRAQKPQTVDDILDIHDQFMQKTLEACLLTNRGLIRSLTKLMNTCLLFTDQMKRFMDTTKLHDDIQSLAVEKRGRVQKSLNERGNISESALDRRVLRRALDRMQEERQGNHQKQTRRVGREVSSDSYRRMVARFSEVFTADLADFMKQLNSATSSGIVANLGIRLDYNGYITASISKQP